LAADISFIIFTYTDAFYFIGSRTSFYQEGFLLKRVGGKASINCGYFSKVNFASASLRFAQVSYEQHC